MRALDEDETATLLNLLETSRLCMPVMLAVTTGLRRGEILGLRWSNVDLTTGTLTVVESLEQTKAVLRFKPPKTHRSRRSIALPGLQSLIGHTKDEPAKFPATLELHLPARGLGFSVDDLILVDHSQTNCTPGG